MKGLVEVSLASVERDFEENGRIVQYYQSKIIDVEINISKFEPVISLNKNPRLKKWVNNPPLKFVFYVAVFLQFTQWQNTEIIAPNVRGYWSHRIWLAEESVKDIVQRDEDMISGLKDVVLVTFIYNMKGFNVPVVELIYGESEKANILKNKKF